MARLEYLGSLYTNKAKQVVIPGENIEACLVAGAKKIKQGPQAKSGIFVERACVLEYGAKLDPEKLWKAGDKYKLRTMVRVQNSRLIRTRPKFDSWSLTVEIKYMDETLSESTLDEILTRAGRECGLGDWRPRYGRFTHKILK